VPTYEILEVVSGLGMGGAEKALIARLKYLPKEFNQTILNVRPEIDALKIDDPIKEYKIYKTKGFRFIGILKYLRQNHFDAIIFRTPLDAIRFGYCKSYSKNKKVKLIFEAHSNFVSKNLIANYLFDFLLRLTSKELDLVIAVSENVKSGPLCKFASNVQVVYLGSHLNIPTFQPITPKVSRLLFVGRLVDLKRPIWLLERMLSLNSKMDLQPSTLTIVGTGPLEKEVKEFVQRHGLGEVVSLVGNQSDVSPYYAKATHLVSCSTNEGLPLTFFEAKLSGLCIVSTPSGGGSEIFSEEDFKLSSFDKEEFEQTLSEILVSVPPTGEERKGIQSRSQWMNAENGAQRYYFEINELLSK
jgi:glycosyltransferase involved in cell wall biosynthesis